MEIKDIISIFLTLSVGVVAALWAYTTYILERGFLPPVRFYVTLKKLGKIDKENILDIKIHLHNIGSATLIARNIRLDLLYLKSSDTPISIFGDIINNVKVHDRAGKLVFPNSVIKDKQIDPSSLIPEKIRKTKDREKSKHWEQQKHRGFLIIEHDTFVQRGVDQVYTFVTTIPENAICCLTWCSFQYAQEPRGWQKMVARVSRRMGLIQYTLEHVQVPHTVEDVFWIAGNDQQMHPAVAPKARAVDA